MSRSRTLARLVGVAGVVAALITTIADPTAAHRSRDHGFPDRLELPDGFPPEGITIGPGPTASFGSRLDGDIYQIDLRDGDGRIISEGPGTPSIGLKSDHRGRLFVAGGSAGDGRVVDIGSGEVLASYQFTTGESFVNDVLLTPYAAWFTDSAAAQLYAVPLSPRGGLPDEDKIITLPLSGDWEQGEDFGANGLTATPDRKALLVVHSGSGLLHRVSPFTGETAIVDLGDTLLTNGDGMLLHGNRLYVVQNQLNQIAVIKLSHSGRTGRLVDIITSPDFDVPTTVASFGHRLYLPNGRFTTEPTPETEYWVSSVRKP